MMRVVDAINASLHEYMRENPAAHIMGEDILDPYGGAFKATKGLSSTFPDRVITTPISEAGIAGFATGMAMKGKPVCLEIMFGDFITLCTDQIINHMSKLPWVYNDQIRVPVVIRTPMGGKRGYGATHSQSLEKHYCGVPGLTILAVSQYSDIAAIYRQAFAAQSPHIIIENKICYARTHEPRNLSPHAEPDLTIITYGGSVEAAVAAATCLEDQEELAVNIFECWQLHPLNHQEIATATANCNNILVVEEGNAGWGLASEIAYGLIGRDELNFRHICAPAHPIPSSKDWESEILPGQEHIISVALSMFE